MITLFIDTSLANVTISILKEEKILALIQKEIPNMHSVYTTSFIKEAIDEAMIDANMIDKIMAVTGPGSFTGVRIGVTIAKTYGYLIKREITPVSSLKALAISSNYMGTIMSIIPANKNSFYVGIYDDNYNEIQDERFARSDEIMELIDKYDPYIVGVNSSVMGRKKINKVNLDVIKIMQYYKDKDTVNYYKLVPNYLKLPQAIEDRK